jgi:hypothetical protein
MITNKIKLFPIEYKDIRFLIIFNNNIRINIGINISININNISNFNRYSNMNKYSNICRCENIRSNNNVVGVAVNSSGSGSSSVSEGVHIIIFNF